MALCCKTGRGSTAVDRPISVSFLKLFSLASRSDFILLAIGLLAAAINGAAFPAFSLFIGDFMDEVGSRSATGDTAGILSEVQTVSLQLVVVAAVAFSSSFVWDAIFTYSSTTISTRIRIEYFRAVLNQDISWFDQETPAALPSRMNEDVFKVGEAIGYRVGLTVANFSQFVCGYSVGLYRGWQLALVMMSTMPLLAASIAVLSRRIAKKTARAQDFYAEAGAVAEEVLSSIKTVVAFGAEKRESERYDHKLIAARDGEIKAGFQGGVMTGIVFLSIFLTYALVFWYGGVLIYDGTINPSSGEPYNGGDVITVYFACIMATFALGQIAPNISFFVEGKTAGAKIFPLFEVQESPDRIEPPLSEGPRKDATPLTMSTIAFRNVSFHYPAKPEVKVLSDVSFTIKAGEKVAFVGESGSGKSTSVQLLERFYDPTAGEVLINGDNVRGMHVYDLRAIYGYVGQEPFLFATSIRNNLTYGIPSSRAPDQKALVDACRKAQVLDFIQSLPNGFDTYCGAGGGQISGGQKQRIAIARALLRHPQVLLLDEATSALDNESEKMVQKTIDHLQEHFNITTISIAHRLSTIRNSDRIIVMKGGQIVETGTHSVLMQNEGEYRALVSAQEAALSQEASQQDLRPGQDSGLPMPTDWRMNPTRNSSVATSEVFLDTTDMKLDLGEDEVAIEKARKKQVVKSYRTPYRRLLQFSRDERYYYIPACIGAAGKGLSMPLHALIVSGVIDAFYLPDREEMKDAVEETALKYVGLAVGVLVSCSIMQYFFAHIGEHFTFKVRRLCFAKLLEQDVGYFDDPAHAPGKLTAALSTHALKMKALTGQGLGLYVEALSGFIGGVLISLTGVWQLGLVMTCILPLLILSWKIRSALWWTGSELDDELLKQASQTASEAVQNMRTVRAFVAEAWTVEFYTGYINRTASGASRGALLTGLAYGTSTCMMFLAYAAGFYYGGYLIEEQGVGFREMLQSLMAVMLGSIGVGNALAFLPDLDDAKVAAHDVLEILDTESKINAVHPDGTVEELGDGSIEFKSVHFQYPTRPDVAILKGLSFKVEAGQQVALVGPSGGGKSTVIALLQRFYDPSGGSIAVGGTDHRMLNVAWWRRHCGLVSQEPVLFDMTLAENLRYGKAEVTDDDLIRVAKMSKMDFAAALGGPFGWDDGLGPRGSRLSGGQKQRTAIGRALVRDPAVMFLDEATSALDSASERVVQDALETAAVGRTTFTIAHRLSTIKRSDIILVISDGRLVEQGPHDTLISQRGVYYDLYTKGQQ